MRLAIRSKYDGPGAGPRHDFGYSLSYTIQNALTLVWGGRLMSGSRFTPTVAGDVNGDGSRNDRAFVFDPAKTTDVTLAASMQRLLSNGSSQARECLKAQLNQIANRNSCVGPWTMGNTTFRISPNSSRIHLPLRTSLIFTVSNPIGAADLLLHGSDKVHGWGQTPFIDQSLLFVRGFDVASLQYKYEVNQRFGSSRTAKTTSRTPVIVTMQMSVELSPTRDWQNLRQQLDRGRTRAGTKMVEGSVRSLSAQLFPNPMARMLQVGEQLHLSRKQADSLATMSRRYTRLVDSLWTPTAKYLAALPRAYNRAEAQTKFVAAREVLVDYLILVAPGIKNMLTKGQSRVLSVDIANYFDPHYLESVRSGLAIGNFTFFF